MHAVEHGAPALEVVSDLHPLEVGLVVWTSTQEAAGFVIAFRRAAYYLTFA